MKKKRYAILINYGPEIRSFILSGLAQELLAKHKIIIFIKYCSISNEVEFPEGVEIQEYKVNQYLEKNIRFSKKVFILLELFLNKIRKARQRKIGVGNYHFTKGSEYRISKSDKYLGNKYLYKVVFLLYHTFSKSHYFSPYIEKLYKKHNVTDLIYYGSNMTEMKFFLHTAERLTIKLWHYIGNWKDIYIDDLIPVLPNAIFVWSNIIKNDLLRLNPTIKEKNIVISGNWFFNSFKSYVPKYSKEYYAEKYGFDKDRPILLWPLSMKVIFPNEQILIQNINEYIATLSGVKPVLLLRDNPFGAAEEMKLVYSNMENVRLCIQYWRVLRKEDFTFQLMEGEEEWLDLLHHSFIIVSTPSTVSLESILMNKKCINILFDETGNYSEKIAAFAKAPFYSELLNRPDIVLVESLIDFKKNLMNVGSNKNRNLQSLPNILSGNRDFILEDIVKNLEQ